MNKNDFKNLLQTITEAYYDADADPRNAFIDRSKLKPWERLVGGDILDIPGGEEAWKKQQAELAAKTQSKPKKPETLPLPDRITDRWPEHLQSNGFGLSQEAHQKALELAQRIKGASTSSYPRELQNLHDHLTQSGVHPDHPHLKAIYQQMDDANEMNRDKARSRAGY